MLKTYQRFFEVAGIFCFTLFLFTWGLSSQEVIGFDSRFYLFAQEMWRNGISIFPTTYDQPYPDYPATAIIVINLFAHLFGGLNKLIAVLPTAIMAALTLVLTYLIGERQKRCLGWFAVCLMLLTLTFFKASRAITLDMYTTAVTTACFYVIYSADRKNKIKYIAWIYPLLLLGFIFRGPIGLVVPAGVICIYYLLAGQIKKFLVIGFSAFVLLAISTSLLLACAYQIGGESFMQAVLRMEVLGRMGGGKLPYYFYFTESLGSYALAYPFALATFIGVLYYTWLKRLTIPDANFLLKLFGWAAVVLIGMSIPGDKKVRYVLPMVPALALLAAYPFTTWQEEKYFQQWRKFFRGLFLYFPLFFLLAIEVVFFNRKQFGLRVNIYSLTTVYLFFQSCSFWFYYHYIDRIKLREVAVVFFAAMSFVVAEIAVLEPMELQLEKARAFVVAMEAVRLHDHAQLVFYKENPDSLPIKYLINMPQREKPIFIQAITELKQVTSPTFFVTSVENFMRLPPRLITTFRIIGRERMGHVEVVVFSNVKKK
jgi:4-amino-4-deoxy-L-arabinose transferase-like glycosyltransferase